MGADPSLARDRCALLWWSAPIAAPNPLSAAASSCAGSSSNPTDGMVVLRSSGEGRCTSSLGDDRAVGGSAWSTGSLTLTLDPEAAEAVLDAGASVPLPLLLLLLVGAAESVEVEAVGV